MSDTSGALTLELEKRDITGKAVKRLRQAGKVPAVIHDHGQQSVVVSGEYLEMQKTFQRAGKHHPITLKAGGKTYTALIKETDFNPRTNFITHVVFGAVKADETVDAEVPVHIDYGEGNEATPAERGGLIVLQQLETVEVAAKPADLPDELRFNGEKLAAAGDQATVADLVVPKGVEVKTDPQHVLATVFEPSALAAANDEAGGTAQPADAENVEAQAEGSEPPADGDKA